MKKWKAGYGHMEISRAGTARIMTIICLSLLFYISLTLAGISVCVSFLFSGIFFSLSICIDVVQSSVWIFFFFFIKIIKYWWRHLLVEWEYYFFLINFSGLFILTNKKNIIYEWNPPPTKKINKNGKFCKLSCIAGFFFLSLI